MNLEAGDAVISTIPSLYARASYIGHRSQASRLQLLLPGESNANCDYSTQQALFSAPTDGHTRWIARCCRYLVEDNGNVFKIRLEDDGGGGVIIWLVFLLAPCDGTTYVDVVDMLGEYKREFEFAVLDGPTTGPGQLRIHIFSSEEVRGFECTHVAVSEFEVGR